MTSIRVLALDPAFRNVGLTLADVDLKTGEFKPIYINLITTEGDKSKTVRKNSDNLRCVRDIHSTLERVIKEAEVKYIFAEVPVGSQNARAAQLLGAVMGILGCLSKPLIEVTPLQVKKIVDLGKKPSKKDIITWAMNKYPDLKWHLRKSKGEMVSIDGKNEHIADSVAVLEAGFASEQWREIQTALSLVI